MRITPLVLLLLTGLVLSTPVRLRTGVREAETLANLSTEVVSQILSQSSFPFQSKSHQEEMQVLIHTNRFVTENEIKKDLDETNINYLPEQTFIVLGNPFTILEKVKNIEYITKVTHYSPNYKTLLQFNSLNTKSDKKVSFYVYSNHPMDTYVKEWKQHLHTMTNQLTLITPNKLAVHVSTFAAQEVLHFFSHQEIVHWIEGKIHYSTNNLGASGIVQSGSTGKGETSIWNRGIRGKGELVGIGDTGIDWDMCFFNDSSVSLPINRVDFSHRKIVAYYTVKVLQPDGTIKETNTKDYASGHGTHTSGSISGSIIHWESHRVDTLKPYNGMAPDAKLVFTDLMGDDGALTIPESLEKDYFPGPYQAGARIHSNSWGCSFPVSCVYDCNCVFTVNIPEYGIQQGQKAEEKWCQENFGKSCCKFCNQYTGSSLDVDSFVYKNDDFLVLFAAGNTGHFSMQGTVSSPATCKNCLSIGASQTTSSNFLDSIDHIDYVDILRQVGLPNTDACCSYTHSDASYQKRVRLACCPALQKEYYKDPNLFNQNNLAFFSSRGMTEDNRYKPDIVAPGYQVQSMHSDGRTDSFQCGTSKPAHDNDASVVTMKGTSMATPITAGSLALIREYLRLGYYPTGSQNASNVISKPSSALIRAMAIHSATPLAGSLDYDYRGSLKQFVNEPSPNAYSGFGLLTLNSVLKFNDSSFSLYLKDRVSIVNEEKQLFCIQTKEKGNVRITVAWTDYPPVLGSLKTLVNDIGLTAWWGSKKMQGNGQSDDSNTVEQVTMQNVDAMTRITVQISARVVKETVNYAIVVTGNFEIVPTCEIPSFNIQGWEIFMSVAGIGMFILVLVVGLVGICLFMTGCGPRKCRCNYNWIYTWIVSRASPKEASQTVGADQEMVEEIMYYQK